MFSFFNRRSARPLFEHRHFKALAAMVRNIFADPDRRYNIARQFADKLEPSNTRFDRDRFMAAAMGQPINGRDAGRYMNARHAAPDVGAIMAYEAGALDAEGERKLFQELVNSGLAWKLQGSYGRTAAAMIRAGVISAPELNASSDG